MTAQAKEAEGSPIRNTRLRRALTLLALKTTAHFYRRRGVCVPITWGLIVKTGPFVHLSEAATMQFLAENTSLPIPRIYYSFVHKDRAYIVMERIRGVVIPEAWGNLPRGSRDKVFAQLKHMFSELRALKPTNPDAVESCLGGSLRDSRIPRCLPRMGPFNTVQEFHLWLRNNLIPSDHEQHRAEEDDWRDIVDMAAKQDGPWPPTVFTHADLNPFNILVRGDDVVGIIDWEFSGWYPHYWEYTSAWYGNMTRTEWQGDLDKFLVPFREELQMEKTRQMWWGE